MDTSKTDPPSLPSTGSPENHYRDMFEHSVAGMYRSSAEGRLLEANQAMADILGYESVDQLYDLDLARDVYANPAQRERLLEQVERDGVVQYIEMDLRRKDGSRITAMGSMRGIHDAEGHLDAMEGTLIDISERERATRALKASEQRYRRLVESLTDGVFETTPDGRMLRANQALVEMLDYDSEEELLAVPVSELYAQPGKRDSMVEKTLASGGIRNQELALLRKDGSTVYCLQNSRVIYGDEGKPVRFEGTLTDLSDLRRREASRRQLAERRERQNRALLDLTQTSRPETIEESYRLGARVAAETLDVANVGVWLFDGDETLRSACLWNLSDQSATSGMEIATRDFPIHIESVRQEHVIAADDASTDPRTAELAEGYLGPRGITSMLDVPIRRGAMLIGILCHEHTGPPRRWLEDEIAFAASIAAWISQELERHERRRTQEKLLTSEKKYRDLFESTVSGFFRVDSEGRFLAANPAFLEMLGYESEAELEGVSLADDIYVDHGERSSLRKAIADEPLLRNVESELRRRDSSIIRVFGNIRRVPGESGETLHYEGSFVDVTERAELEIQLRQSQKMEALGKLAGGVAHDFNNLITVMLGYIDLALGKVDDDTLVGDLEQIRDAAERAAAMTRHLLAYTRQQVLHPRLLDLNEAISDVSRLLDRLIGEDVELILELTEETCPVQVDPGQLQQVIINLAVNARDAMREGGRLTIRTRTEVVDRPRRMSDFVIEPGRYVVVTVIDDGQGMDEETLSHALEPFFTTKPVGQGTGLGLSTAYGIVKQSGGYISLTSEVGRGTEIDLYVPAEGGDDGPREADRTTEASVRDEGIGQQIVLLVEDDRTLRELATSVLESQGYRVLAPDDPHQALALFDRDEQSFDLLVTDVVMPGLSGLELARRLREERPDLPVLLISGYPPELSAGGETFEVEEEFLAKPFGPKELVDRVRALLGRRA